MRAAQQDPGRGSGLRRRRWTAPRGVRLASDREAFEGWHARSSEASRVLRALEGTRAWLTGTTNARSRLATLHPGGRMLEIPCDNVERVFIHAGARALEGDLRVPRDATGLVLFAHGSGSSRHSSRNRFVAAALIAAARHPSDVAAVVSRGGRPDLAAGWSGGVRAPTLLMVGGEDRTVIRLNEDAFEKLAAAEKSFEIVPGATHLFEEPGTLEAVEELATEWFARHLR